jgi:hypothetical protein
LYRLALYYVVLWGEINNKAVSCVVKTQYEI